MTDLLALTRDLVAIASESHAEAEIVGWLEAELRAVPWLTTERVGLNLVARTTLDRPVRVLFAGHTDTVPANGDNATPRIEGDTLWGLGATDMKAGVAVMLELARTVSEPAVDVTYVFYAGEEVAAVHNGLGHLFRDRPDLLEADVALLGEPTDAAIEAGCQGTMRLQVTLHGKRAHPARPWMGRNAIHKLGRVLAAVEAHPTREPVIDGCRFREALQAVGVTGGVSGNVVPDLATVTLNHRFAPDRSPAEAEAAIRAVLAPALEDGDEVEVVDVAPAAAPSLDHPVLAALIERNGLTVEAKLGWTDVARFAEHGIPATNYGPGHALIAHTAEERVDREPIERSFAALDELLRTGP
ncbi:succinyl-diaminopimelate desuccinylase [Aquihabitans sp. G128]|uniref:succinyl-diaminopimelate desuccinylase n=1 Tax=Aquihabitans sp. G128 TaxID=2849779 RepID=UPI0020B203F8|nr:succinyl-diaminopimelate desuccinylase [Aquihabitans sp. G128]